MCKHKNEVQCLQKREKKLKLLQAPYAKISKKKKQFHHFLSSLFGFTVGFS